MNDRLPFEALQTCPRNFRRAMKREAVHHSKMKRLCRKLNLETWQAVGLLESIWLLTARQTPCGNIGKLSDEDIAIAIDYHGDEQKMIGALVDSGWIDRNEQHRLIIHDWPDHAEDGVHMRIARAREFFICQGPTGETVLEIPKLSRFFSREREPLREFYENYKIAQENAIRAHGLTNRAHVVRTDIKTVRTKPQSVAKTLTLTSSLTLTAAAANGTREIPKLAAADFPTTAALLSKKFPAIDSAMVMKIIQAGCQAWRSIDDPKIPAPDDEVFVAAIESAKHAKQISAALFLRTVPAVISNWARSGRSAPDRADPNRYKLGD